MYEIDFFTSKETGTTTTITLRYGNLLGARSEQTVMVWGGGGMAAGQKAVRHIKRHYGTDIVDLAILPSFHPDCTKSLEALCGGLRVIMMAMHRPWNNDHRVANLFVDSNNLLSKMSDKLLAGLKHAKTLESVAAACGVSFISPLANETADSDSEFVMLWPSRDEYINYIDRFVDLNKNLLEIAEINSRYCNVKNKISPSIAMESQGIFPIIMLIQHDNQHLLFTGLSGLHSICQGIQKAKTLGISMLNPHVVVSSENHMQTLSTKVLYRIINN